MERGAAESFVMAKWKFTVTMLELVKYFTSMQVMYCRAAQRLVSEGSVARS